MKIERNVSTQKFYRDLSPGDCFYLLGGDTPYIKLKGNGCGVNLCNGEMEEFEGFRKIEIVNAKVVVL